MNQNSTTDPKFVICNNCHCTVQKDLVHHVFLKGRYQKICTSCVLFSFRLYFCPACLGVHDLPSAVKLFPCKRCKSYSHASCLSVDGCPSEARLCSSCIDPSRMVFDYSNGINLYAARLLLTATRIVNKLIRKAKEEADYSPWVEVVELLEARKKAIISLEPLVKFEENNNGPSLLDPSSDGKEDGRVTGKLQRLSIAGAANGAT